MSGWINKLKPRIDNTLTSGPAWFLVCLLMSTQIRWLNNHGLVDNLTEVPWRLLAALLLGILLSGLLIRWLDVARWRQANWLPMEYPFALFAICGFVCLFFSVFYPNQPGSLVFVILLFASLFLRANLTGRGNWILFFAAAVVVITRDLDLLTEPRIWAEDGEHFLEWFYNNPDFRQLFHVWEYYRLLHSITAYLTVHLLPLEYAAHSFTLVALIIQLIPFAIICFGQSSFWNTPFKKFLLISIILFAPSSEEIWINLNGNSYYLIVITSLVLLAEVGSNFSRWSYRVLLLIAGLMGLLSCLFTPFFLWRAWRSKEREHWIQTGILIICCVLQLVAVIYTVLEEQDILDYRRHPPNLYQTGFIIWVKAFMQTLNTGWAWYYSWIFRHVNPEQAANQLSLIYWLAMVAIVAIFLFINRNKNLYMLAGMFTILVVFVSFFGIGGEQNRAFLHVDAGNRYFYAPNVLLSVILVSQLLLQLQNKLRSIHYVSLVLAAMILFNGIDRFYSAKTSSPDWPDWQEEVSIWRNNPDYEIRVWPPKFKLQLLPRDH